LFLRREISGDQSSHIQRTEKLKNQTEIKT